MEQGTMQCFYFVSFQVHTGTAIWARGESYFQKQKVCKFHMNLPTEETNERYIFSKSI